MGTRAAFWIGNPIDLVNREWLGCVAWDGHPHNFEQLSLVSSEKEFREAVDEIANARNDFAYPDKGWPFPWDDDIFLTDVTYAFFDGATNVCWFYKPFKTLDDYLCSEEEEMIPDDSAHHYVPAPKTYDLSQPDSIMFVTVKRK